MDNTATRKVIHIDMDAFDASVEQRDNPAHRGRPVAVGHGKRRGVVAAASYEARAFGVRSAIPSTVAMKQCPDLIFVPPRFDAYQAVSHQIHAIFANYTPLIEPLSLDEAYLDVTANLRALSLAFLTQHFGRAAGWYYGIARGQDDRPVVANRERKSSGSGTTFQEDLTDPARIEGALRAMADEVWDWCEETKARGRTITVKIK